MKIKQSKLRSKTIALRQEIDRPVHEFSELMDKREKTIEGV
jgi:hypothetical protein